MTIQESSRQNPSAELAVLNDTMAYIAMGSPHAPEVRAAKLEQIAGIVTQGFATLGPETNAGEYSYRLSTQAWLACMPTLRKLAANRVHTAEDSRAVFEGMQGILIDALAVDTNDPEDIRANTSTTGKIAELAVLSVAAWQHAETLGMEQDFVVPATSTQDNHPSDARKNIDLVIHRDSADFLVQVKGNHTQSYRKQLKGHTPYPMNTAVKLVYASRLLLDYRNPLYAPELLANAVVSEDEDTLVHAGQQLDIALNKI